MVSFGNLNMINIILRILRSLYLGIDVYNKIYVKWYLIRRGYELEIEWRIC